MSQTHLHNPAPISDVSQEILKAIDALKFGSGFGSVEIVLHEGRITQIEKREKVRFANDTSKSTPTANRSGIKK